MHPAWRAAEAMARCRLALVVLVFWCYDEVLRPGYVTHTRLSYSSSTGWGRLVPENGLYLKS